MAASNSSIKLDEIGAWSEIKLEIIHKYAKAYSIILNKQGFIHAYIDGFSGAGIHVSRATGGTVPGSPTIALEIQPPFSEYHFVDLNKKKIDHLRSCVTEQENVFTYHKDCNKVLVETIFPRIKFEERRRALCLLDPYGLHLSWEAIRLAGQMRTIELFINFPVVDINRNVLWKNPEGVSPADIARMNFFWGDESWRDVAYRSEGDLFGFSHKTDNEAISEGFRQRLLNVAGFKHVPKPIPMRNKFKAIVYYLFFASPNETANKIVTDIFKKYR